MARGARRNLTTSERAKLAELKRKYASGVPSVRRVSPSLSPSSTELYGSARMPKDVVKYGQTIVGAVAIIIGIFIIYALKEAVLDFLALFR